MSDFIDPSGAIFKRQWFKTVERTPEGLRWARYWDLAASTRTTGDYTASAAVALARDGTLYIRDMVRGRWEWPREIPPAGDRLINTRYRDLDTVDAEVSSSSARLSAALASVAL